MGLAVANKTALDLASKVVKGNYLPAAKVNAMWTLVEFERRSCQRPKHSLQWSRQRAVRIANNPKMPAHLRGVALQGLDRHVRASKALTEATKAASDKRNSIAVAMVAIINSHRLGS